VIFSLITYGGYEPARQYLKRFETGEMQGYLSIITVAELAAG
jgi:hypothetical protein